MPLACNVVLDKLICLLLELWYIHFLVLASWEALVSQGLFGVLNVTLFILLVRLPSVEEVAHAGQLVGVMLGQLQAQAGTVNTDAGIYNLLYNRYDDKLVCTDLEYVSSIAGWSISGGLKLRTLLQEELYSMVDSFQLALDAADARGAIATSAIETLRDVFEASLMKAYKPAVKVRNSFVPSYARLSKVRRMWS
jgi:hypothetical protein